MLKTGTSGAPEYFFRDLVETMSEAVWVGDKHERTIYANPKFCEIMEYSLEEMIGRESYDFWDTISKAKVREHNEEKRKKGVRSSYEGTLISKSGKKIPVILSGSPIPGGGTVGIMTDMREYRKLEKRAHNISQAISMAGDCIFSYTEHGEITSWNKGSKDIFGYRQNDLNKDGILQLFPNEPFENFMCPTDILCQMHFEGRDKQGNIRILSGAITSYGDTEDTDGEYLFIGREVTNEVMLEEKIEQHCSKIKNSYIQIGLLQRRLDYLQDLFRLGRGIAKSEKYLYDSILRSLMFLSGASNVHFWKCDTNNTMTLVSALGTTQFFPIGTKKTYTGSANEKSIIEGKSVKIINPAHRTEFEQFATIRAHHGIYSALLLPIGREENPIGVFELYVGEEGTLELFEDKFIDEYIYAVGVVLELAYYRELA